MKRLILAALLAAGMTGAARADDGLKPSAATAGTALKMTETVLLQPDFVFQERVRDVAAFATYIRTIESVAAKETMSRPGQRGGGFLVVAVRPGGESNVWLDLRPGLQPDLALDLISRIRAITPPTVEVGPVVFALKVSMWGGTPPSGNMPESPEWKRAIEKAGHPIEIGALVQQIWQK